MAFAPSSFLVTGVTALAVTLLYLSRRRSQPKFALSCPPGPNVSNLPTDDPWVTYQEWGREYGDLIYIREKNMLITNKTQVAVDLLEKRARIYSDRESSPTSQLCEADHIIGLQRYSNKWRKHRRFFHQTFRQSACSRFYPAQYKKINDFLRSLTTTPENFMQHTVALSLAFMYAALYGLDIGVEDPLSRKAVRTMDLFGQILFTANEFIQDLNDLDTIPFEKAMNNVKTGAGSSIIAEMALEKPADIEMIKAMGGTSFMDTTMSAMSSAILTLTLHPDVQVKAQAEIDHVVGRDRLPTFEDRESLPYVEAIYREVMRLHPLFHLNHVSTEDDFYQGYHIPQGCVVLPNIWAMNRDPDLYPEPDKFMPERFLEGHGPFTNINDIYAYGFGRRVCVGRYVADTTVWLTIVSILATLDLRKAKDDRGHEIDIPEEYTQHFFRYSPKPYQSSIKPRDSKALALILAAK
ncbi:cytochrome P450 [Rhodocollybia butyracea]|uniref:Cytochrome P450 n=1 Tax=Rhodocollybia butyracea TaxID=206335 RepID=A0A9P5UF32_9AGAR|nr:cytochrome P450 [Rhodocollybia butyracea]